MPGKRADGTEKNRLEPLPNVVRQLWVFCGNECAFDGCTKRLVTDTGAWIGKIAHIVGAEPGSARHDESWTDDLDRYRDFSNLMLLCANHHDEVDHKDSREKFTVEYLRAVKQRHEARFRYTLDNIEAEFRDLVQGNLVTHCSTLQGHFEHPAGGAGLEFNDDERTEVVQQINRFADRVGGLTRQARQLLAFIVQEVQPPDVPLVQRRFGESQHTILSVCRELENAGMAFLHTDPYDEEVGLITLSSGALEGWTEFWDFLREFTVDRGIDVADVLVGLDFSLLD